MEWTDKIDEEITRSSTDSGMLKFLNPQLTEQYIAVALSVPTAPELVALTHLSVIASLVGTKMKVEAKPGYETYPIIWSGAIVPSGGAKSPSAHAAHGALKYIQEIITSEYEHQKFNYEMNNKKGEPPFLKLLNVGNGSIQGQLEQLMRGDGAAYRYQDEMSGFFSGFNQHTNGKGNEEEKYLELWNGTPICEYNKGGNYIINKPRLSLMGMSQPSVMLPIIAKATNNGRTGANGMFSRFLLIYPEMPRMEYLSFDSYCKGSQISNSWDQLNHNLLKNLHSLEAPTQWTCDEEGDKFLYDYFNKNFRRAEKTQGLVRSFFNKDKAHVSRLAGVLAVTDWALEEDLSTWNHPEDIIYKTLTLDVLERAVGLYEYFLDQVQVIVDAMQPNSPGDVSTTSLDVDASLTNVEEKLQKKFGDGSLFTVGNYRKHCMSGPQRKRETEAQTLQRLMNLDCLTYVDGQFVLD